MVKFAGCLGRLRLTEPYKSSVPNDMNELVKEVVVMAQRLDFARKLPPKESLMFLDGIKYECGSDYKPETLAKSVGELNEECRSCVRKGWYYAAFLHDDVMAEDCNCQYANGLI